MKATGIISITILSLLLGTAALAYAQQDQPDKNSKQDEKAQKDKSTTQDDKSAKQEDKAATQENKNNKQEERNAQPRSNNQREDKTAQQQDKNNQQEQNARQQDKNDKQNEKNAQPAQRVADNGRGRIPEDRFRANFGREHSFRVRQDDYSRDRRFQYGGYSFGFVDAWPSNWLYSQDVFVVEIDGVYYLCNAMYPGVNVTLSIGN